MKHLRLVTILLLLLFVSCTKQYLHAIKSDFHDAIKASVGVGLGLHADVKVTALFHPGIGWFGWWKMAGTESRYSYGIYEHLFSCLFPLGFTFIDDKQLILQSLDFTCFKGSEELVRRKHGDTMFASALFDPQSVLSLKAYQPQKYSVHPWILSGNQNSGYDPTFTEQPFGLEMGLGIIFFSIRLGFDLIEFIDLLMTIFGYDILHDNDETSKTIGLNNSIINVHQNVPQPSTTSTAIQSHNLAAAYRQKPSTVAHYR